MSFDDLLSVVHSLVSLLLNVDTQRPTTIYGMCGGQAQGRGM